MALLADALQVGVQALDGGDGALGAALQYPVASSDMFRTLDHHSRKRKFPEVRSSAVVTYGVIGGRSHIVIANTASDVTPATCT